MAQAKRKVLFITQEYSAESTGGAGVYAYELCKALAESGEVEVHALVPGTKNRRTNVQPGLVLHERWTIFRPLLQVPIFYFQVWWHARKLIKSEQIDLIHTNENAGITVLGRLPNVATIHHPIRAEGKFTTLWQRLIILPDVWMEKVIMRRAGHIMVPSHLAQNLLLEFMPELKTKVTLVQNGLDRRNFKPQPGAAALRKKMGVPAKAVMIFFPGGLRAKRKGTLDFIAALRQLSDVPEYRVVISGKNRELGWQNELSQALSASGLADRFIDVGEVAYADLPRYFAAADFVVYPSLFEGYGLPVIEAMASGKAVIATRTGEAPYIVKNGESGVLVDVGRPDQLATAVKDLLEDEKKRERLGAAGHQRVSHDFDWRTIVSQVLKQYQAAERRS